MPTFPVINDTSIYKQITSTFLGYNRNLKIKQSEFYDMKNMTSSFYPILSPRPRRGIYSSPTAPQGMIGKDSLCYVDGRYFVVNGSPVDMNLSTAAADCPKSLISMGAYVIILPDKKYINTKDLTDFGNIEASVTAEDGASFSLCTLTGDDIRNAVTGATAPNDPANLSYWIDTSSTPHALRQWNETNGMWVSVATTYVKISAPGIGVPFNVNDGITISGIAPAQLSDLNGTVILWGKGDDYLIVTGIIDAAQTQTSPITVERQMPDMDFITESENRLWGCRYGVARNGEVVNEIYACKLGDFRNWNCFMGISTDSYVVSVGTDGQFTGAVTHLGRPIFFKEDCLHKIYGSYPANYQVQTTHGRGVQRGCERSLAIVNEVLYYKSRSAVCAYDGSLPTEISTALGDIVYGDAVAGAFGNKYYISMKDEQDGWNLFVFDTAKGIWHKEDSTHALDFCTCRNELYFIDADDKRIYTVNGSGVADARDVEWMAETGAVGIVEEYTGTTRFAKRKYISRLVVRMALDRGSSVTFFIEYDSDGHWERLFDMNGTSLNSFSIPIRPRRCDHFRIRIEGRGDAKIYSFVADVEEGSDLH